MSGAGVANVSTLLCFLHNIKAPPSFQIQNFTFVLYPVNTAKCPHIDGNKYITFNLYTRRNPKIPHVLRPHDDNSLATSYMDFHKPTVIFFHGFTESLYAEDGQLMRRNFLQAGDYNVIITDARILLAGPYYIEAVKNCRFIGMFAASLIDYLITRGFDLRSLHVIGFSLGGQISGFTGQFLKSGRLPRITGLDPAGPLFLFKPIDKRLDPSDAEFVEVIHSNRFLFGYGKSLGHADFYPNGGGPMQPGCTLMGRFQTFSINELVFCEHFRSYKLFSKSIIDPFRYPAMHCSNYLAYKAHFCKSNDVQYMGLAVNTSARGDYFIYTGTDAIDIGW